jgi:hypothetical protein
VFLQQMRAAGVYSVLRTPSTDTGDSGIALANLPLSTVHKLYRVMQTPCRITARLSTSRGRRSGRSTTTHVEDGRVLFHSQSFLTYIAHIPIFTAIRHNCRGYDQQLVTADGRSNGPKSSQGGDVHALAAVTGRMPSFSTSKLPPAARLVFYRSLLSARGGEGAEASWLLCQDKAFAPAKLPQNPCSDKGCGR